MSHWEGVVRMEMTLSQAIHARAVVSFDYHGEHRMVEPYRLGRDRRRLLLHGWQARKGWRSFAVAEMGSVEVTGHAFEEPREGYVRGDPRLERILAEV